MNPKLLAFYLPQFHPIAENNRFWGEGFTEWTNVKKAAPLFRGHYQPANPTDLGMYSLLDPYVRVAQAEMARKHGIYGFCYYHYWFGGGKRVLEKPFDEVLRLGEPNFPFALCWANQSWTGVWYGAPDRVLIEQTYPGEDDFVEHFYALLPAFKDKRYIRVANKPLFLVFRPSEIPDKKKFTNLWSRLAIENGLEGIHFIGFSWDWDWDHIADGFNAMVTQVNLPPMLSKNKGAVKGPSLFSGESILPFVAPNSHLPNKTIHPCLLPNWDNTPRSGVMGSVMLNSTPENFRHQVKAALLSLRYLPENEKVIFVKAWNEWAEGNYLEPEVRYGLKYLEVLKEELGH